MRKAKQLRRLLAAEDIVVAPGASSALFARLIEESGFAAVYATGAGIANMQFGFPDIGLVTMSENLETVKRINAATTLPVIADIDNGYGNALNTYRTVKEFSALGIAALQLEDQALPKKCGHFSGKALISREEMVGKIRAAKDALQDQAAVLIARTDAIAVSGFEDAMERAAAYAQAGADLLFVEAPVSVDQLRRIPAMVDKPVMANMVEGGATPLLSNADLQAMGYKLVIYANAPLKAAVKGTTDLLIRLREDGTTRDSQEMMITMEERNRLTGRRRFCEMEGRYRIEAQDKEG